LVQSTFLPSQPPLLPSHKSGTHVHSGNTFVKKWQQLSTN
jgi:hypothetical protein